MTFGSKKPQKIKSPSTTIDITLRDGSTLTINANVIPSITGTIYRGPIHIGSLQKGDHFLNQYDHVEEKVPQLTFLSAMIITWIWYFLRKWKYSQDYIC